MKIKNIVTVLLIAYILTSCAPATKVVPTETAVPTSTFTPVPTATTKITSTPTPESLADAKDLSVWVDRFVRTYNVKVTVDSLEMDANQLTDEILKNDDKFTVLKKVKQNEILFLVVNGIPLAIREGNGQWREITPSIISSIYNIKFGYGNLLIGKDADKYYFHKYTDIEQLHIQLTAYSERSCP